MIVLYSVISGNPGKSYWGQGNCKVNPVGKKDENCNVDGCICSVDNMYTLRTPVGIEQFSLTKTNLDILVCTVSGLLLAT
jgi:hypothetical protein